MNVLQGYLAKVRNTGLLEYMIKVLLHIHKTNLVYLLTRIRDLYYLMGFTEDH